VRKNCKIENNLLLPEVVKNLKTYNVTCGSRKSEKEKKIDEKKNSSRLLPAKNRLELGDAVSHLIFLMFGVFPTGFKTI